MKGKYLLHFFSIITLVLMSACGKSEGAVNPEPNPEPEPQPETYITIADRNTKEDVKRLDATYVASEIWWIVRSNVKWTFELIDCNDWLTAELSQNILFKVSLSVNTAPLSREGSIRFKDADTGDILADIPITQSSTDRIGGADFMDMVLLEYDRSETQKRM